MKCGNAQTDKSKSINSDEILDWRNCLAATVQSIVTTWNETVKNEFRVLAALDSEI